MQFHFKATEFGSPSEAIQHATASINGVAITTARRFFVVDPEEAERLETAGRHFGFLAEVPAKDGSWRVACIPINA